MNAGNLTEFGMMWLWRMSWQSAILVLLVLAAQWLFRDKLTPRWRFNLWWLVIIRLMVPVFPESPLSVFNLAHISFEAQINPPLLSRPVAYAIPEPHIANTIPNAVHDQDNQAPVFLNRDHPILEQTRELTSVTAIQQVVAKRFPIFSVLAWIWIAGVLFHGGRLCLGSWMLSRKIRDAFPSLDEDVAQIFETCRKTMRVARSPEIVVTSAVQSPALFGFLRIKLLIPYGMAETFSPGEWRHIFMHELAHIRRRDVGLNWLMAVLHMLHWFNPIAWSAFKRMHSDRELACDAMVLSYANNGEAKAYGRTIIKLLEGLSRPVAVAGLVGILESKNQIKQRIHMIAQFKPAQRRPFLAGLLLAMLCVVGMTDAQSQKPVEPSSTSGKNTNSPLLLMIGEAAKSNTVNSTGTADQRSSLDPLIQRQFRAKPLNSLMLSYFRSIHSIISSPLPSASLDAYAFSENTEPVDAKQFESETLKEMNAKLSDRSKYGSYGDFVRQLFSMATGADFIGQDLNASTNHGGIGKERFMDYNSRTGVLNVRARESELEAVNDVVSFLNDSPAHIVIEVKILEIPQEMISELNSALLNSLDSEKQDNKIDANENKVLNVISAANENASTNKVTGVGPLSHKNLIASAHDSESPSVQMQHVISESQFKNLENTLRKRGRLYFLHSSFNSIAVNHTNAISLNADIRNGNGTSVLSILPKVRYDDRRIDMDIDLKLSSIKVKAESFSIEKQDTSRFRVRNVSTGINRSTEWDGKTIVLGGLILSDMLDNKLARLVNSKNSLSTHITLQDGETAIIRGPPNKDYPIRRSVEYIPVLCITPRIVNLFSHFPESEESSQQADSRTTEPRPKSRFSLEENRTKLLERAVSLHKAGQFESARLLSKMILWSDPDNQIAKAALK